MYKHIDLELVENIANYFISHQATVRSTAIEFHLSKSTIHLYLVKYVPYYFPELYPKVRILLDKNKKERHLRGGIALQNSNMKKCGLNRPHFLFP